MMWTELIVVACITGACSVFGQVIISRASTKAHGIIMEEKLSEMKKKLDSHNCFMERLALTEQYMQYLKETLDEVKVECKEFQKNANSGKGKL